MKFICTQENLVSALTQVVPIAGRNTQLPVLEHILLQVRAGVLHCTATDLSIAIHRIVPGKAESEGACTVPARSLAEFVQQLPTQPITLEKQTAGLVIKTRGVHGKFPIGNDEEFPLLPKLKQGTKLQVPGDVLCQALGQAVFAAARDDVRPEIHSVFVRTHDDQLTIAATDSFRLAEVVVQLPTAVDPVVFLLPLTTAQEIVRLFPDDTALTATLHDTHATFATTEGEVSSRLVEGNFPDYRQIIPTKFSVEGTFSRDELLRALKTLVVFLPRDSRRVRVAVEPGKDRAVLTVAGSDHGEGRVEVAFTGTGDDLEILFNIQYLLDGVQRLSVDTVTAQFVGTNEPAVFRPPRTSTTAYTYVVMPIQAST